MAVSAVKAAKSQSASAAVAEAEPAPGKSGKVLKMIGVFVVASAFGGGAVYWHLGQRKSAPAEEKPQPAKPPVFVALEQFTVNLQLEDTPQFMQVGLSLQVTDNAVIDTLKLHMPVVRHRVLLLLSSRKASELLAPEGKRKLSTDIVSAINDILVPPDPRTKKSRPPQKTVPAETAGDVAEGADKAERDPAGNDTEATEPSAPAAQPPVITVLFTSFIIQ